MRQQVREGGKLLSFPGLSSLRIGTHKKPHFQTEYTAHIKPVAPERAHTLHLAVLVGLCTLSQYPAPTPPLTHLESGSTFPLHLTGWISPVWLLSTSRMQPEWPGSLDICIFNCPQWLPYLQVQSHGLLRLSSDVPSRIGTAITHAL